MFLEDALNPLHPSPRCPMHNRSSVHHGTIASLVLMLLDDREKQLNLLLYPLPPLFLPLLSEIYI